MSLPTKYHETIANNYLESIRDSIKDISEILEMKNDTYFIYYILSNGEIKIIPSSKKTAFGLNTVNNQQVISSGILSKSTKHTGTYYIHALPRKDDHTKTNSTDLSVFNLKKLRNVNFIQQTGK